MGLGCFYFIAFYIQNVAQSSRVNHLHGLRG